MEKAPRSPAAWFAQGIAVHSAAEYYENSLGGADLDAVQEHYGAEYNRLISEGLETEPDLSKWLTGGRVRAADDIHRRRERGLEMLA